MRVVVTEAHPREVDGDAVVQVFVPPYDESGPLGTHLSTRAPELIVPDPESLTWLEPRRMKAPRLVMASLVGTEGPRDPGWNGTRGEAEDEAIRAHHLRSLGGVIERGCFANDVGHVALAPLPDGLRIEPLLEGMLLRAYGPTEFRKRDLATTLGKITVCVPDKAVARTRIRQIEAITRATNLARGLADLPGNEGFPQAIVDRVQVTAKKAGLQVEALDEPAVESLGMGLLRGVGRGAGHPLRVLILEHRPGRTPASTLALIGKGLTHDTGGYNLKTTSSLHELTYDKAGGMAVVGAMHAIADLDLPIHVVGIVPLVENCVDAHAYKPGDILRAMDGTTVYIDNTDAEGRLALADCLTFVKRYKPKLVVDLATLTGSCEIALGEPFAGLFSNDDRARELLVEAGRRSGDLVWPMPIHDVHMDQLSYHKAQLRNTGIRAGGASSAAGFLRAFTRYPWAHVDMAGKAAWQVERDYQGRGATGFGTRLLVEVARGFEARFGPKRR